MKANIQTGRSLCMQLSVDAARWPDRLLEGLLRTKDGRDLSAQEVRQELSKLKDDGLEVVPCGHHECDEKGHCQGEPL